MLALCIQIAIKLSHFYSPDMLSLQLLEGKLKCLLVRIQGGFISVSFCSGQSELACICLFVQFNNQLDV